MGNSLADQLLKAGMVSKQKVKKVKSQKQKQERMRRHNKIEQVDEAKQLAAKAEAEKLARDRELNRQRKEAAERKALAAQARQLIETHRLDRAEGDIPYHFNVAGRIQTLRMLPDQHRQLVNGLLAIVLLDERFELVPLDVADKIEQRVPELVVHRGQAETAEDDTDDYAGYEIPDDLMW